MVAVKKNSPGSQIVYFPPDEGFSRGTKSQEILWCLARGIDKRDARGLIGFSGGYWAVVIKSARVRGAEWALLSLRSLGWPIDPLDSK